MKIILKPVKKSDHCTIFPDGYCSFFFMTVCCMIFLLWTAEEFLFMVNGRKPLGRGKAVFSLKVSADRGEWDGHDPVFLRLCWLPETRSTRRETCPARHPHFFHCIMFNQAFYRFVILKFKFLSLMNTLNPILKAIICVFTVCQLYLLVLCHKSCNYL